MVQQIQVRTLVTTYIVLDGMDECSDESRRKFLTCLGSLVEDQTVPTLDRPGSVLKILITSRPDEEIFDIIPFSKHFEITDSLTTDDIGTLIVTGVEQLGNRRHLAPDVQSAIKNFLYTNAKGMFLWVVLVLQELDRRDERLTDDLIATRLRKVPLTLATVYEGILENAPKSRRDDMWRILRCMLISVRVMSPIELKAALCIEIGISEWHDFIGDVKHLCGSLIRITDEKVRFVHQCAQDFLETYAYRTSTEQLHGIFWQPGEAEIQIITVCLKCLLQDGLLIEVYNIYPRRIVPLEYEELMHDILKKWPFLSYAAEYWAFHLRNLKQPNQNILRLTLELLSTQMNRDMLMRILFFFTHYRTACTPREGTQLHIAAYLDLSWLVAGYIHTRVDVNAVSDSGDTALVWGSEMGSTESVQLLLQAGANPNIVEYDGWSPLHWATTNGHAEICRLLLEHGACIDAVDDHGATPHHLALSRGHDMALAELDRFRAKGTTSKDQDAEGEYWDLSKAPWRPNNIHQGLYNGRLAMSTFPHLHETGRE